MTWNVVAISARVLALALFASRFLPWAIGLIVTQIIIFSLAELYKDSGIRDLGHQLIDRLVAFVLVVMLAMSSVLNILLTDIFGQDVSWMRRYRFYSRYWLLMMIENSVLISIWYVVTLHEEYWYSLPALCYVLVAYFISFIIKTFHVFVVRKMVRGQHHIC